MNLFGVYLALAFLLSLIFVKFLTLRFQQKLIDIPNERSSHRKPTPRGGGLGFIFSFYAVLGLENSTRHLQADFSTTIWFNLFPLIIISFLDDWKNLPASIRYLVQLSVSTIVVAILGAFPFFSNQANVHLLDFISITLTVLGMTALINFYNFMDGLDGILAGTAIMQFGYLALWWNGNQSLWVLAASILGFLWWNWQPAKIFMGDSGSTFIGAAIAIALLSKNTLPSDAWSALSITLPITLDTIYTLVRRLMRRENIFRAHRSHLFQRLHQSGWSHAQVSSLYIAASLILSLTLLTLGAIAGWINLIGSIISLIAIEIYLRSHQRQVEQ